MSNRVHGVCVAAHPSDLIIPRSAPLCHVAETGQHSGPIEFETQPSMDELWDDLRSVTPPGWTVVAVEYYPDRASPNDPEPDRPSWWVYAEPSPTIEADVDRRTMRRVNSRGAERAQTFFSLTEALRTYMQAALIEPHRSTLS